MHASRALVFLILLSFLRALAAHSVASSDVPDASPEMPKAADSFVDAIGVNTHFSYKDSPYVTAFDAISAALIGSGIRHIRDGRDPRDLDYLRRISYLGSHGIRTSAQFEIHVTSDDIKRIVRQYEPYIEFVEPNNEFDAKRHIDPNWAEELQQDQGTIYHTIHNSPEFGKITVLGPALSWEKMYAVLGPLDDVEDAGNLHNATCNFNPGTKTSAVGIPQMTKAIKASTQQKPIWTTETGYNDDPAAVCSLADNVIAKYDIRTVAERFNAGEPRIYFYQLADTPSDHIFGAFGLLDRDGKPKPQFTALTGLISQLRDPGPSFALKPLGLSITSSTNDVNHTLLQRRDGSYDLLLWRSVTSWISTNPHHIWGSPVSVDKEPVVVTVPTIRTISEYAYDSSWKLSAMSQPQVRDSQVQVPVDDTPLLLVLR